ncbi:response regulator [Streptomyces avermitilis]|uniref:response regulator n=1 Tax=Streptomyces avermitilis TaxID=33903 RepID=UPI0037FEB73E
MTRVLIVDDDAGIREALSLLLCSEGYEVTSAVTGHDALEHFSYDGADLILLDWMMPSMNGIDVCRELRKGSDVPIIMVSAKDHEADKVLGLEMGADDYVTKPFSGRELLARIRAVLRGRRANSVSVSTALETGCLRMDVDQHLVTLNGEGIHLPLKEFELLQMLLRNAGRVLTRQQLLDRVWGVDRIGDVKTLDVHIRRLRAKIEPNPKEPNRILTIRGVGYKLQQI